MAILGTASAPVAAQSSNPKLYPYVSVPGAEKATGGLLDSAITSRKTKAALKDVLNKRGRFNEYNGDTVVELRVTNTDPALLKEIAGTGAKIISTSPTYSRVTVTVSSPESVLKLASIPEVTLITPVLSPKAHTGSVPSRAERALNVDPGARQPFETAPEIILDGTGQKVGILSDSCSAEQVADSVATGDLPADIEILADTAGADEGAAMAELVYDLAPGAKLAFHTAFISESDFANGIGLLADAGCSVIVDDVIYFAEPFYEDGIVAQAAAKVVEDGIPYYSAAGNFANDALQQKYVDVNSSQDELSPVTGKDLHKWPNGTGFLPIVVPPQSGFTAYLQWNQPQELGRLGDGSQIDLDLVVALSNNQAGLTEVYTTTAAAEGRASVDTQGDTGTGKGDPFEAVHYANASGITKTVYLAIDHYRGAKGNIPQGNTPLEFTVIFSREGVNADTISIQGINPADNSTGGPTIWGHSVGKGVVSVGAVNYYESPIFLPAGGPTTEIDPEPFSAKGGTTRILFDEGGQYSPRVSFEPDIACVDATNTTFFGGADFDLDGNKNFFGTSAAAPNAAAVAALALQLNPSLSPAQINSALSLTAIDVKGKRAATGTDNVSGVGLIDAHAAVLHIDDLYGRVTDTLSENHFVYAFPLLTPGVFGADNEGWILEPNAEDPPIPGYTTPGYSNSQPGSHGEPVDHISIYATNNTNTLGWLKSPDLIGSRYVQSVANDPRAISGITGLQSLYRASYNLSASSSDQSRIPTFRLRQSAKSFEQSNMLVITSSGDGSLSPSSEILKTYKQYFCLPDTQVKFNLYFDLLGVDSNDRADVFLNLDEVVMEGMTTANLAGLRNEVLLDFTGGTRGWTRRNIPEFSSVGGSSSSQGLTLGPASSSNNVCFGFWSGPDNSGEIVLDRDRLYCATFRIKTSASPNQITRVPTFRLRANDSSNKLAAILDVSSTVSTASIPTGGAYQDYRMYFQTPEELAGNRVRFSFDYLFVPGIDDDANLTVTLERFSVDSYMPPTGPL